MKRLVVVSLLVTTTISVSLVAAVGGPPPADKRPPGQEVNHGSRKGNASGSHDRLSAYRRAAKAGNVNAAFEAGDMLLKQATGSTGRKQILECAEGLGDLFFAATNGNAKACADLSHALENGIGMKNNLISAYALLELATERNPSFRGDLDRLVVRLAPDEILRAQALASEYAQGHWPTDLVHPVDQGDPRLSIQGVTSNGHKSLAIINNICLGAGDSAIVQPANGRSGVQGQLSIVCQKIGDGYVLVSIAGESHWKLLSSEPLR